MHKMNKMSSLNSHLSSNNNQNSDILFNQKLNNTQNSVKTSSQSHLNHNHHSGSLMQHLRHNQIVLPKFQQQSSRMHPYTIPSNNSNYQFKNNNNRDLNRMSDFYRTNNNNSTSSHSSIDNDEIIIESEVNVKKELNKPPTTDFLSNANSNLNNFAKHSNRLITNHVNDLETFTSTFHNDPKSSLNIVNPHQTKQFNTNSFDNQNFKVLNNFTGLPNQMNPYLKHHHFLKANKFSSLPLMSSSYQSNHKNEISKAHSLDLAKRTNPNYNYSVNDDFYLANLNKLNSANGQKQQESSYSSSINQNLPPKPTNNNQESLYKCDQCAKVFCSKDYLVLHKQNKHPKMPIVNIYNTNEKLSKIINSITSTVISPIAIPNDSSSSTLSSASNNNNSFCEFCNKSFCNKYFLIKHKQGVHGVPEDVAASGSNQKNNDAENSPKEDLTLMSECSVETGLYTQQTAANNNSFLKSVNSKNWLCKICKHEYYSFKYLANHLKRKHGVKLESSQVTNYSKQDLNCQLSLLGEIRLEKVETRKKDLKKNQILKLKKKLIKQLLKLMKNQKSKLDIEFLNSKSTLFYIYNLLNVLKLRSTSINLSRHFKTKLKCLILNLKSKCSNKVPFKRLGVFKLKNNRKNLKIEQKISNIFNDKYEDNLQAFSLQLDDLYEENYDTEIIESIKKIINLPSIIKLPVKSEIKNVLSFKLILKPVPKDENDVNFNDNNNSSNFFTQFQNRQDFLISNNSNDSYTSSSSNKEVNNYCNFSNNDYKQDQDGLLSNFRFYTKENFENC